MTTSTGHQAAMDADAAFSALLSPAGIEDPYPGYARLRRIAPVHASQAGLYVLTRWAECAAALRHPDCLALDPDYHDTRTPRWRDSPAKTEVFQSMLCQNGERHARLRRLTSRTFTPRRVEALHGDVERLVEQLLDELAEHGGGGTAVDLQEVLSFPLPVAVIGRLLGVPDGDQPQFEPLVRKVSAVLEPMAYPAQMTAADTAALALRDYFTTLVAEKRRAPRDDLISALATADAENRLPDTELISTLILILAAGFETAVNLIANGVMALIDHPGQAALLRADPDLAANAVDEILRYDSPVQVTTRTTRGPVELAGVAVPPGSDILVIMGAANRDPEHFTDPDRFDLRRGNAHTALSFSAGPHYCLGATLARLEAMTLFRHLPRRFPVLRLGGTPTRRAPGMIIRGFTHLPVILGS